jgi:hypothetical protein
MNTQARHVERVLAAGAGLCPGCLAGFGGQLALSSENGGTRTFKLEPEV